MIALAWRTSHKDFALKGEILSKSEMSAAPAEPIAKPPALNIIHTVNIANNPPHTILSFLKGLLSLLAFMLLFLFPFVFSFIAEKHLLPINHDAVSFWLWPAMPSSIHAQRHYTPV
jgi:hypothetical protein